MSFISDLLLPLARTDCPGNVQVSASNCFDNYKSHFVNMQKRENTLFTGVDVEILRSFCRYILFFVKSMRTTTNLRVHVFKDWSTPFSFAFGNERTLVTCKSCEARSEDLHATSVLSFPNANEKKMYFHPYIYAQATKIPEKVKKKSMSNFPSRDQGLWLENICPSFLMLHCRRMPLECRSWLAVYWTSHYDIF